MVGTGAIEIAPGASVFTWCDINCTTTKYRPYLSWTDCNLKVEVDPG